MKGSSQNLFQVVLHHVGVQLAFQQHEHNFYFPSAVELPEHLFSVYHLLQECQCVSWLTRFAGPLFKLCFGRASVELTEAGRLTTHRL